MKMYPQTHKKDRKKYDKQYRQNHKEKIATLNKQYQQDHKQEIAARKKRYRQHHKEEIVAYRKKYEQEHGIEIKKRREANKEAITIRSKKYRLNNKESIALSMKKYGQTEQGKMTHRKANAKRRSLKTNVRYEVFDSKEILKRDNYICQLCGKKTRMDYNQNHSLYPNLDHIIPLSKGGTHSKINTQCLCRQCNTDKHNTGKGDQLRLIG